jgi:hypothetical protein
MLVTFTRTGERRYAVRATLEGMPDVEMNPAPGYDPFMPHDLQHFIVERALGIDGAIYGQLAAGGTVGTFHSVVKPGDHRAASRARRNQDRKSSRLRGGLRAIGARHLRLLARLAQPLQGAGAPGKGAGHDRDRQEHSAGNVRKGTDLVHGRETERDSLSFFDAQQALVDAQDRRGVH